MSLAVSENRSESRIWVAAVRRWLLLGAFWASSVLLVMFVMGIVNNPSMPAGWPLFGAFAWFSWLIALAGLNCGSHHR